MRGQQQSQWARETGLDWVEGAPEGRDYAPPGYVEVDTQTGLWWRKTTAQEFNTGWVLFGSGASSAIQVYQGRGNPNGVVTGSYPATWSGGSPIDATIPAVYQNLDLPGEMWIWDVAGQSWI